MERFQTLQQLFKRYRRPGDLVFATVFLLVALFLLSQLGKQTVWASGTQLFAQPRFWPAVGVFGMVGFGTLHFLSSVASDRIAGRWQEVGFWLRGFEFVAWFLGYVWLVPYAGYLLATMGFMAVLTLRLGYRAPKTIGMAVLTGVGIVLLFRTFLQVRLPGGQLYHMLPEGWSSFMLTYF
ncbi:tripartite tricarboxylate transporter TctB family protein [Nioella nitratireducens]|uniref:tripartite tricarboxylate transporter TctB family protein n=1 Tax=Nioella nitratireducens TaxID=1287720 RepID=UPI0008FD69B4|nr:tripartite tricarboxylate transporter TctB family protein [Nioella nitratireducens]